MDFIRKVIIKTNLSRFFYKSFFSSIILIAIILFILASVVYVSFINTLQSEIENANISELTQIINNMDMRFKEIDRIAVSLSSNNEFDYINSTSITGNSRNMVNELEKYKSGNEFLHDIIYYDTYKSENRSKMISTLGEMNIDIFFKYIYNYEHWSQDEFLDSIKNMSNRKVRPAEAVRLNNQTKTKIITCTYPLPINATKPAKVALFIIEQNVLNKLVKNVLRNYSGYMYILDENDRPILSISEDANSENEAFFLDKIGVQSLTEKISTVKVGGTRYSVVKLNSEYNKWKYITVISTDQFMSKAYARKNMFNFSLFIAIIIGTIVSFGFAFQNYKPLRQLTEKLSRKSNNQIERKYFDDIEYIANVIDQIREKNKYLLKEQFLLNLLQGRYADKDEIASAMSETYLKFERLNFLVCVFFIDDYDRLVSDNGGARQDILKSNMVEIAEDIVSQVEEIDGFAVKINDERSTALIINFNHVDEIENKIIDLLCSIKDSYKQNSRVTIGVGSVYRGLEAVKESYSEARKAVYYRLLKGIDNIILYNEIKESEKQKYQYPVSLEAALIKAIKQPDKAEVEHISRELKNYISRQKIPLESIRCICFGIINSVIKIIDEMNMDASDCFIYEEDYLSVQTFDTVDSMIDRLVIFCSKICEYKMEMKENKNLQLKSKIFEIINKRLNDNTLSLESLAAECNMSPSYISRYFKQQTGETLMQHVDQQRMNEVKNLLKNTNMSLKEILNQVGYIDEANFIRKFKKLEGITPMKYRHFEKG